MSGIERAMAIPLFLYKDLDNLADQSPNDCFDTYRIPQDAQLQRRQIVNHLGVDMRKLVTYWDTGVITETLGQIWTLQIPLHQKK